MIKKSAERSEKKKTPETRKKQGAYRLLRFLADSLHASPMPCHDVQGRRVTSTWVQADVSTGAAGTSFVEN